MSTFLLQVHNRLFYSLLYTKEKVQKLLYQDSINGQAIELFNTNSLNAQDKLFDIDYFEPSPDGKFLAVGISSNGDEMTVIKIIDVEKRIILPESIERASYANPSWVPGNPSFFYTQLKEIKSKADESTPFEDSQVKLHTVGNDPKTDKEVFSRNMNGDLVHDKIDIPFISIFPNTSTALAFTYHGSTAYLSLFHNSLEGLLKGSNVSKWKQVCTADDKVTNFAIFNNQISVLSFKDNPNGTLQRYDLTAGLNKVNTVFEGKDVV